MSRFPGVGPRIAARMVALGYRQPTGKPDVSRFAREFGFDKTRVYYWVADTMTPYKELDRLCEILQCTKAWLIFAEGPAPRAPGRRAVPIAGGSANEAPPPGAGRPAGMPLIGRRLMRLAYRWWVSPGWAPMAVYA